MNFPLSKKIKNLFYLAFILIFSSSILIADTKENSDPIRITLNDGGRIVSSPTKINKHEAFLFLGAAGFVGGISLLDRTFHGKLFPYRQSDPSEDLRRWGDIGQVAGPAIGTLFLIDGVAAGNQKSKETGFLTYETFILSGVICGGLKFAVGRNRPFQSDSPYNFKPARGDSSFPSGHTTEAFAAATVFAEQYPHWYVVLPSYAAASAVGFSRMYANQHWASDVVAGAILGTAVSHYLRKWHRQSKHDSDQVWKIGFNKIRWVKKF